MKKLLSVFTVLVTISFFSVSAFAASETWDGDQNTGVWATVNNWVEAGVVPGTGDTATFNSAGGTVDTLDLGGGITIGTILFDNAACAAYTIGAGGAGVQTFGINNGGAITVNAGVVQTQTIAASSVIDHATFTNNGANDAFVLNVTGGVTGVGAAFPFVLTLNGSDTGANTISGVIGNGTLGTVSVTKAEAGAWALSGVNTYTGGTTLDAGTLNINSTTALGGTAGTFTINGGTIDNTSGGAITLANNNAQTWNSSFAYAGTNNLNLGTGAVTLGANVTVTSSTNPQVLTVGGAIGDGGNSRTLTKDGLGLLVLNGNNTYDGVTTINSGTLKLAGDNIGATGGVTMAAGELDINSATALGTGTLTLNGGTIDNSSAGALTLTTNNAQTWGSNIAFKGTQDLNLGTGAVSLGAATRTVTLSTAGKILTIGGVISGTGAAVGLGTNDQGTLTLGGVNTYTGATTIGAGTTLALNSTGTIATSSGVANAGTFTIAANKTIQALTGAGATTLGANTLTIGDANNRSGTYTGVAAGTGGITADGTGTLTLGGANTYTGVTTINTGSKLTLNAAGTIATSSEVANAGTLTIQADKTIQALTGAGATALGANTLTIGDANNRSSTYTGAIGGTGGITKAGTGILTLSGTNTYSGNTTINAGKIVAASASALGAGNVAHNTAGTLDIGSTTLNIGGTYTQAGAATLMVAINGTTHGSIVATGAATVPTTASLVLAVSNYVPNNATYTIIDGTGGAGVAAPAITVTGDNHTTFTATTVGEDLILTASRTANGFASDATSGDTNARSIGHVLDNVTSPSTDMQNILNTMEGLSSSQVAASLDTMVPEVDAGVLNTSTTVLNNFVGASIDRVEEVLTIAKAADSASTGVSAGDACKVNGIWAKGYGSYLTQDTRNNVAGYKAWNAGTAIGADHLFADNITLGISGGYAYGNVDSNVNNANTYINSAQTTIYGGYQDKNLPFFIDAAGTFAWNWYQGQRDINVGGVILRTANASYDGQQYGVYLGSGYKINLTKCVEFTPLISLQYNHLHLQSYTETEAGALDLSVASQDYDQLQSGLGARIASPMHFAWGTFTPEAHGKWFYDFIGDPFAVTSNFNGGGANFNSNGCKPALNSFNAGGQLIFDLKNDVSVIGNCDTEMKDQFFGIYGSVTVRYDF